MDKSSTNISHIHTIFKNWLALFDTLYFDSIDLLTDTEFITNIID